MTIRQKQCLLAYFGDYTGQLDGKWGPLSRAATVAFQTRMGLTVDGIFGPDTEKAARSAIATAEDPGGDWAGIRHFTREDFRCKCGGRYCDGFPSEMDPALVRIGEDAVNHFGKAFSAKTDLVSGLRCPTHNANEGGVAASRHITGKAMDLRIPGITAAQLLAYVRQKNIRYAYAINQTNVHFDVE